MSTITSRFIKCHDYLKSTGAIRSSAAFAEVIETHRQTLNDILKGRREVKTDMLQHAIEKFYLNPYYLFSGRGEMFVNPNVETQDEGDNIKLIPIKAQAGYSDHILDPIYHADLPSFRLPIAKFKTGEFVSFEVEGESMYPTLEDSDLLICSLLEPIYYAHTVKDGQIYVVVTKEEVLVKRIQNKIHTNALLILESDNSDFKPKNMRITKVQEIWKIEGVLKTNLPKAPNKTADIEKKLEEIMKEIKRGE